MSKLNRRRFLATSFMSAAAATLTPKNWANVVGANENIRVATVGFRSRGGSHISGMLKQKPEGVRMVALCDVDQRVLDKGVDNLKKKGEDVKAFVDMRDLLEMKDLDCVTIATPNHWHALAAIWAIQAGKDVYVEKPVSHNVWEGRQLVKAARKYGRICQTGTQARSSVAIKEAVKWVHEGNLGKIKIGRGLCYKPRTDIGSLNKPVEIPSEIDFYLWSGPAPEEVPDYPGTKAGALHYDWHWRWAYGNGDLGNQGIHQMDIARWFLGEDSLAPRVWSVGGRLGYKDAGETPNTQIVYQDYDAAPLIFEVRGLPESKAAQSKGWSKLMDDYKGAKIGVIIECEGGDVRVTSSYGKAEAFDKDGKKIKEWNGSIDHFENFINAVRSRKRSDLTADIWEGHLSSALCHTGNISYRLGSKKNPGEIKEMIKDTRGGEETFGRMVDHLGRNEVDVTKDKLSMGVLLNMDPKVEKFIGNTDADALLTRNYREPFVVPHEV